MIADPRALARSFCIRVFLSAGVRSRLRGRLLYYDALLLSPCAASSGSPATLSFAPKRCSVLSLCGRDLLLALLPPPWARSISWCAVHTLRVGLLAPCFPSFCTFVPVSRVLPLAQGCNPRNLRRFALVEFTGVGPHDSVFARTMPIASRTDTLRYAVSARVESIICVFAAACVRLCCLPPPHSSCRLCSSCFAPGLVSGRCSRAPSLFAVLSGVAL